MRRRKLKTGGQLVQVVDYPQPAPRETAEARAQHRKLSSEAQQRMNAKYSWQKLMWKIAANFVPGDLVVTLTYDDEHLPQNRKQAAACLKRFRANMAKAMKTKGQEFVAVYSTEHLHSSSWVPVAGRWHHHLVIRATGDDFRTIIAAWPYGSEIEIHRFEISSDRNYETLARYMAKERQDTANVHVWGCTRNCRKPEEESFTIEEDAQITIPDGAMFIQREVKETIYGRFEFATWLSADPNAARALRIRKRRRA